MDRGKLQITGTGTKDFVFQGGETDQSFLDERPPYGAALAKGILKALHQELNLIGAPVFGEGDVFEHPALVLFSPTLFNLLVTVKRSKKTRMQDRFIQGPVVNAPAIHGLLFWLGAGNLMYAIHDG